MTKPSLYICIPVHHILNLRRWCALLEKKVSTAVQKRTTDIAHPFSALILAHQPQLKQNQYQKYSRRIKKCFTSIYYCNKPHSYNHIKLNKTNKHHTIDTKQPTNNILQFVRSLVIVLTKIRNRTVTKKTKSEVYYV